jgi:hypothetical protein
VRVPKPQRLVDDVSEWWRYLSAKQSAGYVCAIAGISLTIATALTKGPNQAVLAVLAVVTQGIAAFLFAGHGKAHPSHARSAFGRLMGLAQKVRTTEKAVQDSFESKTLSSDERQTQMGILSNDLGWIGEGIYNAAADWLAFNEPLIELISEEQRKEIMIVAKAARDATKIRNELPKTNDAAQQVAGERADE